MNRECENCIKRKTMWCPPSCECMALEELPYQLDKISALEKIDKLEQENKQLKDKINNALNYIKWHYDLGTKEDVSFCLLRDRLLEILGDKK